jgi:acetyl esterase/lipase
MMIFNKNSILSIFFAFFISLINAQKNATIPRDTSYTIEGQYKKYRKNHPEISPGKDSLPNGVLEYRDLVYTTLKDTPFGDRNLHLDIFTPEKMGKYPALVMIHGGAWITGDKSMQIPMAQKLAAKGIITICVEYQLALEAKYPAPVFNIKSAIRWLRANSNKYNINPNKIAVSGTSAGGQIAMLIGLTNGIEEKEGNHGNPGFSSDIQAIIDLDGVVNFMAPQSLNIERKPNAPDINWLGGSFLEKPEVWKDASSIYWATENSPPILFINSAFPKYHAGQNELIGMMNEWGIYTEVVKTKIKAHTFWLFEPWITKITDDMYQFLNKVFNE